MNWHAFPCMPTPRAEISKKSEPNGVHGETYGALARQKKKHPIIPTWTESCFFCSSPMKTGKTQRSSVSWVNRLQVSSRGPRPFIKTIIFLRPPHFVSIWSRYFVITSAFRERGSPNLISKGDDFLKADFSASGPGKAESAADLEPSSVSPAGSQCGHSHSAISCPRRRTKSALWRSRRPRAGASSTSRLSVPWWGGGGVGGSETVPSSVFCSFSPFLSDGA